MQMALVMGAGCDEISCMLQDERSGRRSRGDCEENYYQYDESKDRYNDASHTDQHCRIADAVSLTLHAR
jgi:hypothetical protein